LAVCVALTAGAGGWAADPDDTYVEPAPPPKVPANQRPGLIDYMFSGKPPAVKPTPTRTPKEKPDKPTAAAPKEERPPPLTPAEREQAAFLRRLAVCDRLREVAEETKDEKLRQLADQLQDRAWQLCVKRANLGAAGVDETVLNDHLGTSNGEEPPTPSTAAMRGDRQNQARVKENSP
jgi:hypothetical protein